MPKVPPYTYTLISNITPILGQLAFKLGARPQPPRARFARLWVGKLIFGFCWKKEEQLARNIQRLTASSTKSFGANSQTPWARFARLGGKQLVFGSSAGNKEEKLVKLCDWLAGWIQKKEQWHCKSWLWRLVQWRFTQTLLTGQQLDFLLSG